MAERILQFVTDGTPGGGTTHVEQVVRGVHGKEYFVSLLTEGGSYLASRMRRFGVDVIEAPFMRKGSILKNIQAVRDVLSLHSPDLIHAHGGRSSFILQCAKPTCPVVYTVHGFHHRKLPFLKRTAGHYIQRNGIKVASHVVFVSNHDREVAISENLMVPGKSCEVIHNGISLPVAEGSARKEWNWRIAFIGRLVKPKNPQMFVKCIHHLENAHGTVIGEGELFHDTVRLVKSLNLSHRIDFKGAFSREQVIASFPDIDCIVMPSLWEGLPILPLEAMWCGVPVVASAVGGVPEVVIHERTGLLVRDNTPECFSRAVTRLASDAALRNDIICNARRHVLDNFTEDVMISRLKKVYGAVLGGSPLML